MSTRMLGSLLLLVGLVISFNAQTQMQTTATPPDLSGTYTGTFNCDAVGLTGDTTLTITGNQFTTADGKTGRIVASSSGGGYMAVALQVGESTAGSTPQIISLRAKKTGNRLTLMPVAGATQKCTFTPARTTTARGRRNQRTPAATGTEVSNPTDPAAPAAPATPANTPTTPAAPEAPIPAQTPSPSPSPSPEASPEPNPSPMPSPTPGGSPMPSPTPGGSPSPMPSPTGSPSPSPTPSPAPAQVRG